MVFEFSTERTRVGQMLHGAGRDGGRGVAISRTLILHGDFRSTSPLVFPPKNSRARARARATRTALKSAELGTAGKDLGEFTPLIFRRELFAEITCFVSVRRYLCHSPLPSSRAPARPVKAPRVRVRGSWNILARVSRPKYHLLENCTREPRGDRH